MGNFKAVPKQAHCIDFLFKSILVTPIVVTPKMILNYVDYLIHRGYFEDCFKVFEKSFRLFTWPILYDLWVNYLYRFVERFEDTKVERTRDLFEKVLSEVPIEQSPIFYLMYANFEERFGLLNHAIEIYDRLVDRCEESNKEKFYNLYMSKVASFLGVTKTRPIFEKAINELSRGSKITMGLRYFVLERKLGEIDRARQILLHLEITNVLEVFVFSPSESGTLAT